MDTPLKIPLTNAQRVRRSKDKAILAGGKRAPDGILSPDVALALDALVESVYADSRLGAVSAAILDAHRKLGRSIVTNVKIDKKIK